MNLTSPLQFMPHGMCYLWNPQMLALQIVSDAGIALAYFSIPVVLLHFLRKCRDIPLRGTIAMFGVFIVACGLTHVMGIWTIWHPAFWLDGGLKAFTAAVSLTTAAMLVPLIPKALTLQSPAQLERLNAELKEDVRIRRDALAESERQYYSLADALPQIVWTANADGALDFYNQRWFDYTGMSLEETKGWGWKPVIHPDDLAGCLDAWTYAVEHGTPYAAEHRFKRASDGTYRWHFGQALPIKDAGGRTVKWFGTATDIDDLKAASVAAGRLTESLRRNERLEHDIAARKRVEAALRASEERFRQVEEHAPMGLALVTLDGSFISVNPALCELTGYSREELLAKTFQELTFHEDLDVELDSLQQALEGTFAGFALEKRYVNKDGRVLWAQLNVSLVRDDGGQPNYFIKQIQDIGARKTAEQAVEAAQKLVLSAAEAKSRFLANMSHEIRTPMNGIIGMTELLSYTKLDNEQGRFIEVIRDSGQSLLRVLDDILDFSKMDSGKLELETLDFDLASQIRSVVDLLEPQFKKKGVSLSSEFDAYVPVIVNGDPGRVRQILMNLVGNALKFTPAGGSVGIRVSPEPGGAMVRSIRFTIVDSGIGIAPEKRERLFQPFSQVDGSTTRKYGGTGLGLSICKQLVDLMGGRIGVDSAAGSGAAFWFVVPFAESSRTGRVLDAPAREMGDRRATVKTRTEKLLLAEDNEVNVLLAIKQFGRLGFDVSVVANGREAVDAVESQRFDLIFMDCNMPVLDGFEASRQIRALASGTLERVPIVAMTANALADDREACFAAGMDDYVAKPVSIADLKAVLARWLPVGANAGAVRPRDALNLPPTTTAAETSAGPW